MNAIDFCYWLQGYFEISGKNEITKEQADLIQKHLNLVFVNEIDPLREKETTASVDELNEAHNVGPNITFRC